MTPYGGKLRHRMPTVLLNRSLYKPSETVIIFHFVSAVQTSILSDIMKSMPRLRKGFSFTGLSTGYQVIS